MRLRLAVWIAALLLPVLAQAQRSYNRWQVPTEKPATATKSAKPAPTKAAVAPKPAAPAGTTAAYGLPDSAVVGGKKAYLYVEQMPEYPGGMEALLQYMRKNLQRPKGKRFSGKVLVTFTVLQSGAVSNAHVRPGNGLEPRYDAAAVDFISGLTGFSAGKKNGEPVDTELTLPVTFR